MVLQLQIMHNHCRCCGLHTKSVWRSYKAFAEHRWLDTVGGLVRKATTPEIKDARDTLNVIFFGRVASNTPFNHSTEWKKEKKILQDPQLAVHGQKCKMAVNG